MICRTCTLVALTFVFAGCLVGSSTKTTHSGKYVGQETLAQVKPGDSEDSVVALLGEPTTKVEREGGASIWEWEYTETTTKKGSVFLLLGSSSTKETQGAVYIEMKDASVVKIWSD